MSRIIVFASSSLIPVSCWVWVCWEDGETCFTERWCRIFSHICFRPRSLVVYFDRLPVICCYIRGMEPTYGLNGHISHNFINSQSIFTLFISQLDLTSSVSFSNCLQEIHFPGTNSLMCLWLRTSSTTCSEPAWSLLCQILLHRQTKFENMLMMFAS